MPESFMLKDVPSSAQIQWKYAQTVSLHFIIIVMAS